MLWGWSLSQYVLGRSQGNTLDRLWVHKGANRDKQTHSYGLVFFFPLCSLSSVLFLLLYSFIPTCNMMGEAGNTGKPCWLRMTFLLQLYIMWKRISHTTAKTYSISKPVSSKHFNTTKALNGFAHNCCLDYGLIFSSSLQVLNTTEVIGRWLGWIFAI